MDTLVPAFVAALLAGVGDRGPWLAAILADRYRRPLPVLVALAIAYALAAAVAVAGAAFAADRLTPEARTLMLAVALLFGGAGAVWKTRMPDQLENWRVGALLTSFGGGLVLAFGDRVTFLAFGFAAAGPHPVMAGTGAAAGSLTLAIVAVTLGEAGWRHLPLRAISTGCGIILLLAGSVTAISALRLT